MKINITYQCDTAAEAKEVLEAVNRLGNLPYRMEGFGPPIVSGDLDALVELTELQEGSASPNMPKSELPLYNEQVRPNVNPGEPSIVKIGEATKSILLDRISTQKETKLENLGIKYAEHLKLLWKRGLVKYDGKEYYL